MTSNTPDTEAYVWIWLPDSTAPVVAGKITQYADKLVFNYGKSYLARENAIAVYEPELPLQSGEIPLPAGLTMPSSIRDAAPDAWGRRVLINRLHNPDLNELTYLLESGSDRIGALDFQRSATNYLPRHATNAPLEELLTAAELVEKGVPLNTELQQALHHGTSIGGARPKAQIEDDQKKYIAKFSSSTDLYSVVKAEFVAMRLASLAGLEVASVSLVKAAGKDILLIERFDRVSTPAGWQRKAMVSGLTLLGLDEMMARYASYIDLAEIIRHRFVAPTESLRELYSRMVFNVLCGNTDDHARNHAAFWDGKMLSLTPAYDVCPQARTGNEATQAMLITENNRMSQLTTCLATAHHFLLGQEEATAIINQLITAIRRNWKTVCDAAELSQLEREMLWERQFLNPFALQGFGCSP